MSNLAPIRIHGKVLLTSAGPGLLTLPKAQSNCLLCSCSSLPGTPCFLVCLSITALGPPVLTQWLPTYAKIPALRAVAVICNCLPALHTTDKVHKTGEHGDSSTAQGGLFGLLMPGYPLLGMPLGECSEFCWKCCSIGFHGACTGFRVWLYRSREGDPETDSRSVVSPGAFWTPRRATSQP